MRTVDPPTLRVDHNQRGEWEVGLAGQRHAVRCQTLDDARQVAHRIAAGQQPCELIVRDAYHRVIERELIGIDVGQRTA